MDLQTAYIKSLSLLLRREEQSGNQDAKKNSSKQYVIPCSLFTHSIIDTSRNSLRFRGNHSLNKSRYSTISLSEPVLNYRSINSNVDSLNDEKSIANTKRALNGEVISWQQ